MAGLLRDPQGADCPRWPATVGPTAPPENQSPFASPPLTRRRRGPEKKTKIFRGVTGITGVSRVKGAGLSGAKQIKITNPQRIMKTTLKSLTTLVLATATTAFLGLGLSLHAADEHLQMKGGQHLVYLNSPQGAANLKKGDTVAMVCAKCKNVTVVRVEKKGGREFLKEGSKHACTGCSSEIVVVAMGNRGSDKQHLRDVKHVCKSCGDDSAFCCATQHGSGKMESMEKK